MLSCLFLNIDINIEIATKSICDEFFKVSSFLHGSVGKIQGEVIICGFYGPAFTSMCFCGSDDEIDNRVMYLVVDIAATFANLTLESLKSMNSEINKVSDLCNIKSNLVWKVCSNTELKNVLMYTESWTQ